MLILLSKRIRLRGITFDNNLQSELYEPAAKVAVTIDEESYRILKNYYGNVPRKLNMDLAILVKGIGVWRHNHAYWLMEETMRKIVPAGIPQFVRNRVFEFLFKETREENTKIPQVLTVNDLKFGFVTWLITCLIAVIAFVVELIWFYGIKGLRITLGLICFLRNLKSYMRNRYVA